MGEELRQILRGETVMVIVPHEDDEINLAGAAIYDAVQAGMRVFCVFVTNGDWYYPGQVRIREAVHSLNRLGVPEENVLFLGYPDGGVDGTRNVYMQGQDRPVNVNGRSETYGIPEHPEFAMAEYSQHQPYLWSSLLEDLETVILKYRADVLISVDLDWHPDHRLCSVAFDQVMGRILNRKGNTYHPLVLKGFAYATAYEANDDLSARNLLSVRYDRHQESDSGWSTDDPALEWERRLRLPVSVRCRCRQLRRNPLYQAMCCHVSQRMFGRAGRIINGDQVFWQRRTDNLAFTGQWTASSGETDGLHDFLIVHPARMTEPRTKMTGICWRPERGKAAWCRCTFSRPRRVSRMILYGAPEDENNILESELSFSNGKSFRIGPLRRGGQPTEVRCPITEAVQWVQFRILRSEGAEAGLAEWEIFEQPDSGIRVLKILCDGQFAYVWYAAPQYPPVISAYTYGIDGGIRWYLNGQRSRLETIQKVCTSLRLPCTIRAEWEGDPHLADEVRILPWNWKFAVSSLMRKWEMRVVQHLERWREKPEHHRAKTMAREQFHS